MMIRLFKDVVDRIWLCLFFLIISLVVLFTPKCVMEGLKNSFFKLDVDEMFNYKRID